MGNVILPKDIEIKINKSSSPLYIQLYEQLKKYIIEGILAEDCKLPTIRSFAEHLNVNNITIVNAYKLLENGKLIYKSFLRFNS